MPDVFLSYSRDDQVTARRFADALQREGFSVWWDQALDAGESFDKVTEQALKSAKAVVVLWSKNSVASKWVRSEATLADRFGTLVPVAIEPCDRPIMFELNHTANLAHWNGEATDSRWRAFVEGLRRTVGKAASADSPASIPEVSSASAAASRSGVSGLTIAAVLSVLLIVVGLLWFVQHRGDKVEAALPATAARTGPVTLAVLPFADLSQAQDQEYFSDGLTEEILNQLAQIRELRVTGRTSSFSFKGKNEDLRQIAQQLGVANLLEGSVRKDGENLRITAQLIDGRDGAHQWSKTYARELKQVFTVQEEIARDVAQALSVTLDIGDTSRATGGTTNVDAYDKYLQARALTLQNTAGTGADIRRLLREAVSLDPEFSRAWLALGTNLGSAVVVASPSDADDLRKERDSALERGVTLAPDTYAATNVRINTLVDERQWNEAGAQFAKLPDVAEYRGRIQVEVGGILSYPTSTGRLNEAIETLKYVVQLEPLSIFISVNLQAYLTASGEFEAAQTEYLRSQPLVGDHFRADYRALLRLLYHDADPRVVQAELRRQLDSQNTQGEDGTQNRLVRAVIESLADRPAALKILRQSFDNPENHNQAILTAIYQLADALDDRELALSALRMLVLDLDSPGSLWLAPHSGVRSDPRFKQLLREVGLVDHFRTSGNWGDFCKPVGTDDFECK